MPCPPKKGIPWRQNTARAARDLWGSAAVYQASSAAVNRAIYPLPTATIPTRCKRTQPAVDSVDKDS